MDLFWAGCLICSSECFIVMKASSFSPGPPDLRRFDLCGMVWTTDLGYCPYQAVVIKIRIASQVLTENRGQVVTLSFWPYTLFMRLLSCCWPCKTVLQKRPLIHPRPPPPPHPPPCICAVCSFMVSFVTPPLPLMKSSQALWCDL